MANDRKIHIVSPIWPNQTNPSLGTFVKAAADGLDQYGWIVDSTAVGKSHRRGTFGKIIRYTRLCVGCLALSTKRCEIIYVHLLTWFSIFLLPVILIQRPKIVIHTHGSEIHARKFLAKIAWPLTRLIISRADVVIAPSKTFKNRVENELGRMDIVVSPSGGVDAKFFYKLSRSAVRSELGLPEKATVLGFVSRIVENKGWRIFLDVVEELSKDRNYVCGLVAGTGDDKQLVAEIKRRKLNVNFLGAVPRDQLPEIFAAMDAFIFASRVSDTDTLGLVALEALSSGIPVVALNAELTREYVTLGENGALASEWTSTAFQEATQQALEAFSHGNGSGERIRASVEQYSSTVAARQLHDVFAGLVADA